MEQIPYAGYRSQYYDDASHHARAWRGTDFVPRNNYVVETWANHRGQSAVARVQSSINYHPDYVIDAVDPEGAVPEDGKTSSHTWRCGWFSINTYITRWTDCHPDMYYETYHNGPHANWYYHGDGNIGWQEDWGPVRFGHAAQWNWITHGDGPTCDVYIYSNTVTRSWGKWFGIWGWEYDYDVQYDSWIFHLPHNQ